MAKVRKAVIPAAGLGTRFLPATKTVPKEMLPIVDRPILLYIVEEAVRAGIEDIVLVAGRGKAAIEDFFDVSYELEDKLERDGKHEWVTSLKQIRSMANVMSIRQKQPLGLGHAVGTARPIVGNEPFAVLLGDEIMISRKDQKTVTEQLAKSFETTGLSTVAMMEVPIDETYKYGIVEGELSHEGKTAVLRVSNVIEKPTPGQTTSRFALPGRYVFDASIFDHIKVTKPGRNGEIQLTDAMVAIAKSKGLIATSFEARRFDAGDKIGYLQANIELGLEHPDTGAALRSYIKRLATTLTLAAGIVFSTPLMMAPTAQASIPNSTTIVSRLAKNSGRGVYVIEQEVRFAGPEGVVLNERWLVQNSEMMRLIVQSQKPGDFRWDAIYRDGKKLATVPQAPLGDGAKDVAAKEPKTTVVPADFFEPYLYYRTSAKFFEAFVKNKILPVTASRGRPKIANIATYQPSPEPAVRLGRAGGSVAWVFGEPTPVDSGKEFPGAWVEQDSFLLKKIRLLSQAEMTLSQHSGAGGGLKLPRERSIVWVGAGGEERSVTIRVTSVKNLPDKSLAPQFLASSITPGDLKAARLPEAPAVREFYSRFR